MITIELSLLVTKPTVQEQGIGDLWLPCLLVNYVSLFNDENWFPEVLVKYLQFFLVS